MPHEPRGAQVCSIAPGRVNLLGEHTDYNEGPVLPAAIDRHIRITATANRERLVRLHADDLNAEISFSLDDLDAKQDARGYPLPQWALYPAGVAWALERAGLPTTGITGSYTSNIPIGSGLSSSAAVQVGFATLWEKLGGWQVDRLTLAQLCQQSENQYVGVQVGLMDQFASACGVEDSALYFDTRSLAWQPVPLPPNSAIIIADSTMRRSLSNSAYNDRRSQCRQAVEILSRHLPGVQSLRDVTPQQLQENAHHLPKVIAMRAAHVVSEIERVQCSVKLLQNGQVDAFGQLMLAGHASLRDLYEVSISELDTLVEIASGLPGCWGARLSGAGFGGCTVNLVEVSQSEAFIAGLKKGYLQATGKHAPVYVCRASRGAVAELVVPSS